MNESIGKLDYSRIFDKQLRKAPLNIKVSFRSRLSIFVESPLDPRLNNHKLTGEYQGCRSINITGDWRAVYIERSGEIIFVALGTHSQLYR